MSGYNQIEDENAREQIKEITDSVQKNKRAIEMMRFAAASVKRSMESTAVSIKTYAEPIEQLLKFARHYHSLHLHGCCHKYFQFGKTISDELDDQYVLFTPTTRPNGCSLFSSKWSDMTEDMSAGQTLYMEYTQNRDKDGNGLIYGFDFVITLSDPNQPPIVKNLTRQVENRLTLPTYSWKTYLATTNINSVWQSGKLW